jgi:Tfp pilus assembly protein PilF
MMMASVAWALASAGKRVLAVDWDLEAPGLHRYFKPFLLDPSLQQMAGIIDIVLDYTTEALTPPSHEEPREPGSKKWFDDLADVRNYASRMKWPFRSGGCLDFISAGRQQEEYSSRVNTFDWRSFYTRLGGQAFIGALRESMRTHYEYVLIDSRTGVSDTSGICTVDLPDILVVCFVLNNQSVEGAANIAKWAETASASRQQARESAMEKQQREALKIFPVPMRLDLSENLKFQERWENARALFRLRPSHLSSTQREEYWQRVGVPYFPYYSYEEVLSAFAESRSGDRNLSILDRTLTLVTYLSGIPATRIELPDENERIAVLARFGEEKPSTPTEPVVYARADDLLRSLSDADRRRADAALTRLVRVSRASSSHVPSDEAIAIPTEQVNLDGALLHRLLESGVVEIRRIDVREFIALSDATLVTTWPHLATLLRENRSEILARQAVRQRMDEADEDGGSQPYLDPSTLAAAQRAFALFPELFSPQEWSIIQGASNKVAAEQSRSYRSGVLKNFSGVAALLALAAFGVSTWNNIQHARRESEAVLLVADAQGELAFGRDSVALISLNNAIALDPDVGGAFALRGGIYERRGISDSAISDFREAVRLDTNSIDANYGLGRLYRVQFAPESARKYLARIAAFPDVPSSALVELGGTYEELGDEDSAKIAYSLGVDRGSPRAGLARGILFERTFDTAAAISDYQRVARNETDTLAAAIARRRLTEVDKSNSPIPVTSRGSATIQYIGGLDSLPAVRLRQRLSDIRLTTRLIRGSTDSVTRSLGVVRYFSPSDEPLATEVRGVLEKFLAEQGYPARVTVSLARVPSSVRPTTVEIQLPALGARPSNRKE